MTKIRLAIEWFLNPDHLPFIVAKRKGIFERHGIDFELIEPDEHYDGLDELKSGAIEFATNEPLHLIEQFDERMLSLGTYFETRGGVLLKADSYEKAKHGDTIRVTTPVSNEVTDTIGYEIIRRFYAKEGIEIPREQVRFEPNGFEHIKYMQEGADAGWLYFYNFEGIEAQHEGMDVRYLDAQNAGFANFSALDLFVNRTFFDNNPEACSSFVTAVKEATELITNDPADALSLYYEYTGENASPLMNDIIKATIPCFDKDFESVAEKSVPILEFFREIGITSLDNERFKSAFLY